MIQAMDELRTAWAKLQSRVDELASERLHYLDFFEGAEAPYLVTDTHGHILEANGAAVDLFNRRRQHLRGKPMVVLIAPADRREIRARMLRLSGAASWQGAIESGGRRVAVEFSARPIPGRGICWRLRPLQ